MTGSEAATLVVPIRSLVGKTRLAEGLSESGRSALAKSLAERVVVSGLNAGMTVTVVSSDAAVRSWALDLGLTLIDDPGTGLDDAATAGIAQVHGRWIVAHADLPLITATALARLARRNGTATAIAPSLDGGTNAISGVGTMRFRFGVGSFHRHLADHPTADVVSIPGLAVDVDTVGHLRALRALDPLLASVGND